MTQDNFKRNMYKGNLFTDEKDYEEAMYYFKQALDESPLNFKANFNVANTYFQLKNYGKAAELFESINGLAPSRFEEAKVFHNLGNSFFMNKKLDEAIDAYKQGLRLNPADEATRYNLAYAQFLKKQEEERDQNQGQGQNENENENEGQGQGQNENENENENQNENEGDENEKEKENESEGDGNESDKEPNRENRNNSTNKISKEQARRILEAAYKREKEIQEELEKRKIVGTGKSRKKDW